MIKKKTVASLTQHTYVLDKETKWFKKDKYFIKLNKY
jgi:hypothetical protein